MHIVTCLSMSEKTITRETNTDLDNLTHQQDNKGCTPKLIIINVMSLRVSYMYCECKWAIVPCWQLCHCVCIVQIKYCLGFWRVFVLNCCVRSQFLGHVSIATIEHALNRVLVTDSHLTVCERVRAPLCLLAILCVTIIVCSDTWLSFCCNVKL